MKLVIGLCDATFSEVCCQGTLGLILRKFRCDACEKCSVHNIFTIFLQ